MNILFKTRSLYSEALAKWLFPFENGYAAAPPLQFPTPPQNNRFKLRARIPLKAINNNQQSLFAHAVKSL